MFNGIIYNQGIITSVSKEKHNCYIVIDQKKGLLKSNIGSSISCNGVCLTLFKKSKKKLFFYLSRETINKSNFKSCKIGDLINLENSLKFGQKISGHYVQGHVDTTGTIKKIIKIGRSWKVFINTGNKHKKYIVNKASITINGVSLTISNIINSTIEITIIPHTLYLTNLIKLKKNNVVNIEFDIFSKYLLKLND